MRSSSWRSSAALLAVGVIVYGYVNDRRAKQMQAELMEEVSQSAAAGEAAAESVSRVTSSSAAGKGTKRKRKNPYGFSLIETALRRHRQFGASESGARSGRRVAPTDLSVLVTGESGGARSFSPQIIHAYSARKHNKYIAVNCGAIPEGTIDSELFGHEKGSFTGAVEARKGYFRGGRRRDDFFWTRWPELPLSTQVRLLRVLQTGEFMRVGSAGCSAPTWSWRRRT